MKQKKQVNKAMPEITLLSNQLETKRKDLLTEHSKAENYLNQIENLKVNHEQKIQKKRKIRIELNQFKTI